MNDMMLYSDKPISKGVENALKRAKQMVELKWTPVKRMPSSMIYRDAADVRPVHRRAGILSYQLYASDTACAVGRVRNMGACDGEG